MKSIFSLALFAAAAFAQNAFIGLPTQGQSVSPGSSLIVQVTRPNTLSGSEEVAVVIGLQSCPGRPCTSPADYMGQILYNGPFSPQYHEPQNPPYENFTVQIPSTIQNGTALIGVAHVTLLGAGSYPWLEVLNQTITIV
ncbi:hypothetical protein HYDPIDRAFT_140319 [Hydnomerulius pinastri MD-312]|uniref:Phosphatidylglycerol/phosphatidylinositol transfer protein n=1 Tax=Hydnomerulius pinastri MD-312 TaxID=994086 RepID=A0A0C9V352_9AGAM|nr:hypothetical protein HYDPIDRAFT_140319 [Hydnomerulius pinastri MD-312]